MSTKKLLCAHDPERPDARGGFVIPWPVRAGQWELLDLVTGREAPLGLVVYVGHPVTPEDLFARLMHTEQVIGDVPKAMAHLESYVGQVQELRIGHVARVVTHGHEDFVLESLGKLREGSRRLP